MSDCGATPQQQAAQRGAESAQTLRLSLDDQRSLAQALANPFSPSEALVRSADAYRNLIKESR